MTTILCATRGGEASIHTQERAIELALERGARLVFLYVADVRFLNGSNSPVGIDVTAELSHMGEFLLLQAKERAENAGVEADTLVKHGVFCDALIAAAGEASAQLIVLGSPDQHSLTQREYLERLVADVRDQTGIDTLIVE